MSEFFVFEHRDQSHTTNILQIWRYVKFSTHDNGVFRHNTRPMSRTNDSWNRIEFESEMKINT